MDKYGDTIDKQYNEFRNNLDLSICLFTNLIEQIESIHEVGFVHNDIKPNNIVFDDISNKFRFIDFGETVSCLDI